MSSTFVLSELLALLHSTPLEPRNWARFLREVCTLTESRHGFFICSSSNLGLHILGEGGTHDMAAAQKAYNESDGSIDPFRMPMLLNPRLGLVEGDDLIPEAEFVRTELYRQVLKPLGLRYLTALALSATPRRMEAVSFWRGLDQGPMPPDKRALLQNLLPHVQIALEVRHKLTTIERRAEHLQSMMDHTHAAAFLLNQQGRVMHQNSPAGVMLKNSCPFELRRGRLYAKDRQSDRELHQLLVQASVERAANGGAMLLHHAQAGRRPFQVVVSPVTSDRGATQLEAILVLVTDPETEVCYPDLILKGLYGLTAAETEVANAYLTGYSSDEIALLRGVSISTVRSQLKVLLHKTGTNRQSDLMRLLMTVPRVPHSNALQN